MEALGNRTPPPIFIEVVMELYPDKWCLVSDNGKLRVLGGWYREYNICSEWKLSSYIVKKKTIKGKAVFFYTEESVYVCGKGRYGMSVTASKKVKEFLDRPNVRLVPERDVKF